MTDARFGMRTQAACLEDARRESLGLRRFDRDVREAQREDVRPVEAIAPTLVRTWRDPAFAAALDAETEANRAAQHEADQVRRRAAWDAVWARFPELGE
jgi:hypothetical protein